MSDATDNRIYREKQEPLSSKDLLSALDPGIGDLNRYASGAEVSIRLTVGALRHIIAIVERSAHEPADAREVRDAVEWLANNAGIRDMEGWDKHSRVLLRAADSLAAPQTVTLECQECEGSGESGQDAGDGTQYSTKEPPCHVCGGSGRLPEPPSTAQFQDRVHAWMGECFTADVVADKVERNHRYVEESLELVQSLGCTREDAHMLVDYVFDRPSGEPHQETGGAMVTLAALCNANGINLVDAADAELARCWTKIDQIRAKQAGKPKHSPLPGPSETKNCARHGQIVETGCPDCERAMGRSGETSDGK